MSLTLEKLAWEDCRVIAESQRGTDADFLHQWAGSQPYRYPLTQEQLRARMAQKDATLYKIIEEGRIIGTFELVPRQDGESAFICRLLIFEEYAGKGNGQKALGRLAGLAFQEIGLKKLMLKVYQFNKRAIRCYEKSGFTVTGSNRDPENPKWDTYTMTMTKPSCAREDGHDEHKDDS